MRAALAEVGGAAFVFAADGDTVPALRAAAENAEMVLLVIEPTVPELDKAMLLAGLGPLATELAPTARIGALVAAEGAESADIVAAAIFLVAARSTTGQVLRIA